MNCDEIKEQFAEYWAGRLDSAARAVVEEHLHGCAACEMEAEHLGRVWETLGEFPEPKPGASLRPRFNETLAAYELGISSARRAEKKAPWWRLAPVWQMGVAAAMLAAGVGLGSLITASRQNSQEVAALRQELAGMRQTVTLSLLQQQNATDRLRGVAWSERVAHPDAEVLTALLFTLNHDQNINVRLSSVDALANFTSSPLVRKAIPGSIDKQDSPLVQVALIDLMSATRGRDIDEALRLAAANPTLNEAVRDRARKALTTRQGDMQ
ncbi:MAG: zf-HC2 domain-containing protein [Bryobacteraceae bacterium]